MNTSYLKWTSHRIHLRKSSTRIFILSRTYEGTIGQVRRQKMIFKNRKKSRIEMTRDWERKKVAGFDQYMIYACMEISH